MSEVTKSVTFEKLADSITIDADTVRVIGSIREKSKGVVVETFSDDVTSLLSPERLAEIQLLRDDAQAWVDNQPFDL